jgi:MFS family permease
LLNLPIGLVVVLLARHYVPRKPEPEPVRDLDLAGALLLGCGVVGLLWPLLSEQHHPRSVAVALVGAVLLLVFAWWERRADRVGQVPMVRPSLFSRPGYSTGTLLSLVYFSGFTGVFFLLTLYFQNGVGYTPLQAGLGLTPFALGTAVSSSIGGRLVPRLGRRQVLGGLLLVVAGFSVADLMLTFGAPGLGAGWWLAAPLLLAGAGSGLMMSANMTLALENVPLDQAGAAAGVLQTGQRLGSATGVAVVGALFFAGVAGGAPLQAAAAHGMHAVVGLTVVASVIALLELVRRR